MLEFNLPALIKAHNQQYSRRKFSDRENWGLLYLSEEGLRLLNQVPALIERLKNNRHYRCEFREAGSYRLSVAAFRRANSFGTLVKSAKAVVGGLKQLQHAHRLLQWEKHQVDYLNVAQHWDAFVPLHPEDQTAIGALKTFWQSQQPFVLATNDFVLSTYDQVMDALWLIAEAQREVQQKKRRMPKDIAQAYGAYLQSLQRELRQLQSALLHAMFGRLLVASHFHPITGNLCADDVLVFTLMTLQKHAVFKNPLQLSGGWQTLDSRHFNAFHQRIFGDGDAALRQQLIKLPWFIHASCSNANVLSVLTVKQDRQVYLAPEILLPFITGPASLLNRLFNHRPKCLAFLQRHQADFAALKLSAISIQPLDIKERFLKLTAYQQQLENHLQQLAQNECPPRWKFWQWPLRKVLKQWERELARHFLHCQQQRMVLIEQTIATATTSDTGKLTYDLALLLWDQLKQIHRQHLAATWHKRLISIEQRLQQYFCLSPDTMALHVLQALANDELLDETEVHYLVEILQQEQCKENTTSGPIQTGLGLYREKATAVLCHKLGPLFQRPDIPLNHSFILDQLQLIRLLDGPSCSIKLLQLFQQLLTQQIHHWQQETPGAGRQRLLALQQLVLRFGDEALQTWFSQLPRDTSDAAWPHFLQAFTGHLPLLTKKAGPAIPVPGKACFTGLRRAWSQWFGNKTPTAGEEVTISSAMNHTVTPAMMTKP